MGVPRAQAAADLDALRRFFVVRHAKAGDRAEWSGDDSLRPLTKKGRKQAEELVGLLESFPINAIFSSPYTRCVQTVMPLGLARRLKVQKSASLAEGHGLNGLEEFFADRRLDGVVLSTHGDIVWELVEDLVGRRVIDAGDGGYEKGSTWIVDVDEHGLAEKARYLPAP